MLVNWSIYQMTSTLPFSYVHIPSPVARIDHGPWLLDQSCAELFDGIQQTPLETPLKDRFLASPWKIKRIEQFSSSSHFHLVFFFREKWIKPYQSYIFSVKVGSQISNLSFRYQTYLLSHIFSVIPDVGLGPRQKKIDDLTGADRSIEKSLPNRLPIITYIVYIIIYYIISYYIVDIYIYYVLLQYIIYIYIYLDIQNAYIEAEAPVATKSRGVLYRLRRKSPPVGSHR